MNRRALPLIAGLALACGDSDSTSATGTDGSSSSADEGDDNDDNDTSDDNDSVDSTTTGESDDDPTTDDSDTSPPVDPPPATGIQIVDVTADQGIRVQIASNGQLVDGTLRNQPIMQNRPAVIRAFYETDPGYEARSILGTLYVTTPSGTESEYTSFINTSEPECDAGESLVDCRYDGLSGGFIWRIPGEEIVSGVTYRIDMVETAPGHEDDVSDKIPVFPTDGGTMLIGVDELYMKMRVVIIPFDHAIGNDCPDPPDLTEDMGPDMDGNDRTVADLFGERLKAMNPVDEVEMIVRPVRPYTGSLTGSQLLGELQQIRFEENAPPEHYYYGVARPCDGGPDFAGVALLGGPSEFEASSRVGWGVYYASPATTAETFVHEIGHEQGRAHIACNGEEGGPDFTYPDHPEGDTESWGMDVFGVQIGVQAPWEHDYMTYCSDTWVSEWGWNKVFPWIQTISSWELMDRSEQNSRKVKLLVGTVREDGTSDFYVTSGWWDPTRASNDHQITVDGPEGEVKTGAAWIHIPRSHDFNVIAPLPSAFDSATSVKFTGDGKEIDMAKSSLRIVGPMELTSQ